MSRQLSSLLPTSSRRASRRSSRRTPRHTSLPLAAGLTAAGLVAAAGTAHADEHAIPGTAGATTLTGVAEATRPAFYEPPATIPSIPGTVIRQEPATQVLDPLGVTATFYDARRIMYSSRDREGHPIAVTGLVVQPRAPYVGTTRRPVIGYAVGTQGMGDRCAPSRQFAENTEYESALLAGLLARGYTLAITDYQGLGTPGTHTYMTRAAQGQAVLDAVRATEGAGFSDTTPESPVGITGYSQGGGAAAAAAELASTYAPELQVKGVAAGAVPADLAAVSRVVDGTLYSAFGFYATAGLNAAYHIDPAQTLSAQGVETLKKVEGACVTDLFDSSFVSSSVLTHDGKPLSSLFDSEPMKSVPADNRIGQRKPAMPALLTHSMLDDVIPFAVGKQLAKDWCAKGATVNFQANLAPGHVGGIAPHVAAVPGWFEARFLGLPAISTCTLL